MNIKKLTLKSADFPGVLRNIPAPPEVLYHAGAPLNDLLKRPAVAIVGSRNVSAYGRQVTIDLAGRLAEQGVVVISGLALGVDGIAHRAALEAGGLAIAVLPSPLDAIAPSTNRRLGQEILDKGGALVSEYPSGTHPVKQYFIARNRLVSGLADAVLITEAGEKSGSLYTARFAREQNRDVLAVPGNITNIGSVGTNNLLKSSGAAPVTSYLDVLHALQLEDHQTAAHEVRGRNAHEQTVLDLILQGINEGDQLLKLSRLSTSQFNQVLTMLEIGGKIRPLGANHWAIF
jgi:DNA processing protein